jgi:hypothetical protein
MERSCVAAMFVDTLRRAMDGRPQRRCAPLFVIPAKAGIHFDLALLAFIESAMRRL